jgi:hypothetical protein
MVEATEVVEIVLINRSELPSASRCRPEFDLPGRRRRRQRRFRRHRQAPSTCPAHPPLRLKPELA